MNDEELQKLVRENYSKSAVALFRAMAKGETQ